jgi:hypothetical protein
LVVGVSAARRVVTVVGPTGLCDLAAGRAVSGRQRVW